MSWKFWRAENVEEGKVTFNAQFDLSSRLADMAEVKTLYKVVDKAADMWIEEHGEELLKRLSPDEVSKRVKQIIAEKVIKS